MENVIAFPKPVEPRAAKDVLADLAQRSDIEDVLIVFRTKDGHQIDSNVTVAEAIMYLEQAKGMLLE